MKGKRILFLIILLVIGFASVSTTLILNGVTLIGSNEQDFRIFFSEAILDDTDQSNALIKDNKQVIDFETNELSLVGDISILDYEVTNNSRQYDAKVAINCVAKSPELFDFVKLEYSIEKEIIPAKERARGKIKATLEKAYAGEELSKEFICTIGANALEKESIVDIVLDNREYYTYGYLAKDSIPVENKIIVITSKDKKYYSKTDARGMFIIDELVGGDYQIFVVDGIEDEVTNLTTEELVALASDASTFNTGDGRISLNNYEIKYSKINPGVPVTHTLTFDTTGGVTNSFESLVIEGEPIGYLPNEIEHDNLAFIDWQENGNKVTNENIYNGDVTLNANYGDGVARIGEKQFRTLNKAFNYISTTDETTIEVLKSNTLEKNITTDKTVILNLNEKTIRFNEFNLKNTGNLNINNGIILADGENVLTNTGTLNTNNTSITHNNNTNETEVITTITNNTDGILYINNSNIMTSFSSYVQNQAVINNFGIVTTENSNIDSDNASFYTKESGITNLNYSTLEFQNNIENDRFLSVEGTLNYNDSTTTIKETNTVSLGVLTVRKGAKANINSGRIDNEHGLANAIEILKDALLNLGESEKIIDIIGNDTDYYTIAIYGTTNIRDGIINTSNGYGYGILGKITIGSENKIPTLNHDSSKFLIAIRSDEENKIINSNLNVTNSYTLKINEGASLTIDNVNLIQATETSTSRTINVSGNLTINDGTYKIGETNQASNGLLQIQSNGTATINGGTFDNTYGKGNAISGAAGSTLNVGENGKIIDLIGNDTNYYLLSASGNLNIVDGIINTSGGYGYGIYGKLTIGSETQIPTLNHNDTRNMMAIRSSIDNRIINGNINAINTYAFNIYKDSNLIIDNINLIQVTETSTSRAINVSGNLTINDGIYKIGETNQAGAGLIQVNSTGTATINSGIFDNTYGKKNSIYTYAESTLNIGENGKIIDLIGSNINNYILVVQGSLNLIDGTINTSNDYGYGIFGKLTIGSETQIPTLNHNDTRNMMEIRSNIDNRIINGNINVINTYAFNIYKDSNLIIDNINLIQATETSTSRTITVSGNLTINDGMYKIDETNQGSQGIVEIKSTGTATISAGVFDNTYGKGSAIYAATDGILNMGEEDRKIDIKGFHPLSWIVYINGTLNVPAGEIEGSVGHFFGIFGQSTFGTSNTIPKIIGSSGDTVINFAGGSTNLIENIDILAINSDAINVAHEASLTVNDCKIIQEVPEGSNKVFTISGTATINNANVTANGKSPGLFNLYSNSKAVINGGNYVYNSNIGNAVYIESDATLDLGKESINELSISNNVSENYPLIANHGQLNIYSGNYISSDTNTIIQRISEANNESAEEKLNYSATINIYGGHIENNKIEIPAIAIRAGRLNMTGGEVVNIAGGNTIDNNGGTAIQTGGISANNAGVTIQ